MKFILTKRTPTTVVLVVIAALTMATAGITSAADGYNPPPQTDRMVVDPTTGLPLPPEPWKDPNWKDPDMVLPEVVFDGLPLGKVADYLRAHFKNAFDVIIPGGWHNQDLSLEPVTDPIRMQLRNVTASEVFNAMNLVFESENSPYRWELKLNGKRPTAILRVLPERLPIAPPPPQPTRLVLFVGHLVGEGGSGGMTIKELVETLSEVYKMSYGSASGVLQFHSETQLLIVNGSSDQIDFVQQTLKALTQKAQWKQRLESRPAESRKATEPGPGTEVKKPS